MASSLSGRIGTVMRFFEQEHSDLHMRICELNPGRQIEQLKSADLDIALIGHAASELASEVDLYPLERLPMCAVLSQTHAQASQLELRLADLRDERFVGLDGSTFPGRVEMITKACKRAGFEPQWACYADGLVSLFTLVAQEKGVTIIPADAASLPHPHAVFVPLLDDELDVTFHAAVRIGEKRPLVHRFLASCRQA